MLPNSKNRICALYSGSSGNSCFIGNSFSGILIDAGKNAKALNAALCEANLSPEAIKAIFITHEHNDHISALPVFLKKHKIPVHVTSASAEKLLSNLTPASASCVHIHPPIYTERVDNFEVTSFLSPHDSKMCVGFKIRMKSENSNQIINIGYATDVGYITNDIHDALIGCQSVVIESNHDEEMLMNGAYPRDLKLRILSKRGHLSNKSCAEISAELASHGTQNFILAHLSEENNLPELALSEVRSAIADENVRICAAMQDCITEIALED